jgi:hypothetical protein
MKIPIELSTGSRDLLVRHFKEGTELHEILEHAAREDLARVKIYSFECEPPQAEKLLQIAHARCSPVAKDIEHTIFAATAG